MLTYGKPLVSSITLSDEEKRINRVIYSKMAKPPSFITGSGTLLRLFPISHRGKYPITHSTAIFKDQGRNRREKRSGESSAHAEGRKHIPRSMPKMR
jgi:hypothetical protein